MSEMDQGNTVAPEHRAVTPSPLLPCPFCGSLRVGIGASQDEGDCEWSVICSDCGASCSLTLPSEAAAVAAWNRRAANNHYPLVEALQKAHAWMLSAPEDGDSEKFKADIKEISAALSAAKGET